MAERVARGEEIPIQEASIGAHLVWILLIFLLLTNYYIVAILRLIVLLLSSLHQAKRLFGETLLVGIREIITGLTFLVLLLSGQNPRLS